jgi:hypothetical protein
LDAPTRTPRLATLHARFLSILPRIELHGRVYFRHLRCPHARQDAVQEMVALSWKWFVRLAQRGKDARRFPSALATFAARAVNSGRRLCGHEKARDVLSPVAQNVKGFAVCPLPDSEALSPNPFSEALADNTQTPVDEQACFRLDFPAWLRTLTRRDRRLVEGMALGHRTCELARSYKLSAGRVGGQGSDRDKCGECRGDQEQSGRQPPRPAGPVPHLPE